MEISKAEISSASAAITSANSESIELRGAEILVKSLQAENVQFIWGYPGGAVLHIYDALFKQNHFKHILVRHEQAAVHAADAFQHQEQRFDLIGRFVRQGIVPIAEIHEPDDLCAQIST
jgi:hypothetical protein